MRCTTKVQLIKRRRSEQWYVTFPAALARAIGLERGEALEWRLEEGSRIVLRRGSTRTPAERPEIASAAERE